MQDTLEMLIISVAERFKLDLLASKGKDTEKA